MTKPLGGLIDAYVNVDLPERRAYWTDWLRSVRLPDRSISDNHTKGFVEVI